MSFLDNLRQKAYQRKLTDKERSQKAREAIMELVSQGEKVDSILMVFSEGGKIYVMEGGLQDDFEALVFISRASYLINRDGIVK